jgi:TolB-like protein
VGVHLGDVVESGGDISGDAVNVASRIEPLAEDGGVCLTRQVYDHVRSKVDLPLSSLGPKSLKNVTEPVEVYKMVMPWEKEIAVMSAQLDKTRIAVLPFTNMSSNPEEGYFADGVTEELITSLSGVRQLTVIARTSVMGYKGTTKKVREIGRELEVGSVLEGSVRKAGSKVRITAQLIDAATEGHLWAQNYDRQLEDVFAIQSEIAEKVAGELRIRLVDSEKRTLEKKPTENTEAYSNFLRGRELFREETEASLRQALGLFEKAIELDPRFARAYVGMAQCHLWLANYGYEPIDVYISIVKTSLERAIDLDPNLPEAHASLSEMFFGNDDMPNMEAEARRALELNPSLPEPYSMLSELAALKGDPGEVIRQTETAYRLDPIRPRLIWNVGTAYLYAGREEEALELWKKTEQLAPAQTYRGMTEYYLIKGELEKAREFHAKFEKLEPSPPRATCQGGIIAALEGDREKALFAIRKIEDANTGAVGFNYIAYVYHALGDLDSFFEYMNKALEAHALIPSTLIYSPLLARARGDPRYLEAMEKIRRQLGLAK